MKFSEIAKTCESVKIDCDICPCQKECSKCQEYMEELSPVGIKKMVESDMEF